MVNLRKSLGALSKDTGETYCLAKTSYPLSNSNFYCSDYHDCLAMSVITNIYNNAMTFVSEKLPLTG